MPKPTYQFLATLVRTDSNEGYNLTIVPQVMAGEPSPSIGKPFETANFDCSDLEDARNLLCDWVNDNIEDLAGSFDEDSD